MCKTYQKDEKPYHLFDMFYTYENKVFNFLFGNRSEVVGADPLSFKKVDYWYVDQSHVFRQIIEPIDPETPIKQMFEAMKNREMQYEPLSYADAKTFQSIPGGAFWKDKNTIYAVDNSNNALLPLPHPDYASFKYLDFNYGKDKSHIYYKDKIIDIDANNYEINKNGFIYDKTNIYHYNKKINLDASSFGVVSYESETNPFMGTFVLKDKNGTYQYRSGHSKEGIPEHQLILI